MEQKNEWDGMANGNHTYRWEDTVVVFKLLKDYLWERIELVLAHYTEYIKY